MDELYEYMKAKLKEIPESLELTISIDCVKFMKLLKMVCYMKQIRRIVDDEI